jgi:hypothetical protein
MHSYIVVVAGWGRRAMCISCTMVLGPARLWRRGCSHAWSRWSALATEWPANQPTRASWRRAPTECAVQIGMRNGRTRVHGKFSTNRGRSDSGRLQREVCADRCDSSEAPCFRFPGAKSPSAGCEPRFFMRSVFRIGRAWTTAVALGLLLPRGSLCKAEEVDPALITATIFDAYCLGRSIDFAQLDRRASEYQLQVIVDRSIPMPNGEVGRSAPRRDSRSRAPLPAHRPSPSR